MRILQIILPETSAYERKSQRIDHAALSFSHEILVAGAADRPPAADIAHLYAPIHLSSRRVPRLPLPYLTNAIVEQSWIPWRNRPLPARVIGPLSAPGIEPVPEAVEDRYFDEPRVDAGGEVGSARVRISSPSMDPLESRAESTRPRLIGSFDRPALRGLVEQTLARVHRFRDDVSWRLFDNDPTPADLDALDAWIDPARDSSDLDGFVAEALVRGLPVVGTRTPINASRLEQGRTGWLVPADDPNELTHAILSALFKPELGQTKITAARQTRGRFRSRQRMRFLIQLYEALRP